MPGRTVDNMPYVDLPMFNLSGQWIVNERERAVTAGILAGLPPAAASGADTEQRWKAALYALSHIAGAIREKGDVLLGDGPVQSVEGAVSLIDIMFELARAVETARSALDRMAVNDPASLFRPTTYLEELESDVTRLRGYLTEAAGAGGPAQ